MNKNIVKKNITRALIDAEEVEMPLRTPFTEERNTRRWDMSLKKGLI